MRAVRLPTSRRAVAGAVATVVGVVAIVLAVVAGNGSSESSSRSPGTSPSVGALKPLPLKASSGGLDAQKDGQGGQAGSARGGFPSGGYVNNIKRRVTVEVLPQGRTLIGVQYPDDQEATSTSSPFRQARTVYGGGPAAIVWIQVLSPGGKATCRVTVDGRVASTRTARGLYSTAACAA